MRGVHEEAQEPRADPLRPCAGVRRLVRASRFYPPSPASAHLLFRCCRVSERRVSFVCTATVRQH